MKSAGFSKKQALKAKVGRGRFNPDLYQDTRQANTWTLTTLYISRGTRTEEPSHICPGGTPWLSLPVVAKHPAYKDTRLPMVMNNGGGGSV